MGVSRCICFRPWNDADQEADADTRQISQEQIMARKGEAGMALLSTTTEDRAPGMGALPEGTRRGSERDKVPKAIVLGMGADSDHGKDATPLPLPEGGAGRKARPPDEAIAIPEAEAVKRDTHTADDLFKGGLLLTEVMWGNMRSVRSLNLDEATSVLSWTYEVVFTKHVETVLLKNARVMCTGKLVKIGVTGKKGFYHFEACDEVEAVAVRDILSRHTKTSN